MKQLIPGHPAADLLCLQRPSLADWYAGPLAAASLAGLQQAAEAGLQSRLFRDSSFRPQLLQLACRFLNVPDYFRLVRRHELLGYLVLRENPAAPQPLDALLSEAAVIKRLRKHDGWHNENSHHDTVG